MTYLPKSVEKRKLSEDSSWDQEEDTFSEERNSDSPKGHMEQEKRMRREIANSNERRRMQSINAGFQSLKTLIPHQDGEKLSKAAILQQTAEHINSLEQEKTRLLTHNAQLKRMLSRHVHLDNDVGQPSPPPKRKKRDTESSDEGISLANDEMTCEELRRELLDLRQQLDHERRMRAVLEEQTRGLEARVYPENLRELATHMEKSMKYHKDKQRYIEDMEEGKRQEEMREELQRARSGPLDAPDPVKPVVVQEPEASPQPAHSYPLPARTPSHTRPEPVTVKEETKACKESPKSHATPSIFDQSMSRKNLETIVEAIRQIEGDYLFKNLDSESRDAQPSESDEKESVLGSDQEDLKSESGRDSGRDSPMTVVQSKNPGTVAAVDATTPLDSRVAHPVAMATLPHLAGGVQMLATRAPIAVTDNNQLVNYPIAMQLLHRPLLSPHHQYISRPGVIVQKSS